MMGKGGDRLGLVRSSAAVQSLMAKLEAAAAADPKGGDIVSVDGAKAEIVALKALAKEVRRGWWSGVGGWGLGVGEAWWGWYIIYRTWRGSGPFASTATATVAAAIRSLAIPLPARPFQPCHARRRSTRQSRRRSRP